MWNNAAVKQWMQRLCWVAGALVLGQMALADGNSACDWRVTPAENLQRVLDGLPENGAHQTICLDPGTFTLESMVTVERSHVTLRGQGQDKTILEMTKGTDSPVLILGDAHHQEPQQTIRDVTVEQLAIRGGGKSDSEFSPELPYLSNSGLIVRRGEDIVLRHLDIQHCRSACLLTEYHSQQVLIQSNHISQAQWDGVSLNRAGPTRILDNTIENNVAAGITVEFMEGSEIANNVIANNRSHGLYLADAERNRFNNNLIRGNELAGVFLTCSVRHRDPVLCWDNSFSRDNAFENNRFEHNRFGFQVAVDKAANCLNASQPPNTSAGDTFVDSPNNEPSWEEYGHCMAFDGSRTVEEVSQRQSE